MRTVDSPALSKETIESMNSKGIPGLISIKVGIDQLHKPNSADVVVMSEFVDQEAELQYQTHPAHEEVKAIVHPLLQPGGLMAVDYDEA